MTHHFELTDDQVIMVAHLTQTDLTITPAEGTTLSAADKAKFFANQVALQEVFLPVAEKIAAERVE